jgi:drug/metabolite transporter (DMT)-like permease
VLLKGYTLRVQHIAGALIGFCGAALIFTGGKVSLDFTALGGGMNPRFWGFLLAAGAALSWAVYSLLTKRLPPFSSFAVGGFCLFSGLLSLGLYFVSTIPYGIPLPTVQPSEWLLLILLGIGPNGIAFFTWDAAVKRGDPRQIGSLTYLTPLLSTFNLVVLGRQPFSILTLAALMLIIAGAVISSIEPERKT